MSHCWNEDGVWKGRKKTGRKIDVEEEVNSKSRHEKNTQGKSIYEKDPKKELLKRKGTKSQGVKEDKQKGEEARRGINRESLSRSKISEVCSCINQWWAFNLSKAIDFLPLPVAILVSVCILEMDRHHRKLSSKRRNQNPH